jgi:hypothetical protein
MVSVRFLGASASKIPLFISKSVAAISKTSRHFSAPCSIGRCSGPERGNDRHGLPVSGHISCPGHEPHHDTIFYVQVEDVGAYLEKAVSLGGKSLVPPIDLPAGTFAWLADPEGNTIGLFQPHA